LTAAPRQRNDMLYVEAKVPDSEAPFTIERSIPAAVNDIAEIDKYIDIFHHFLLGRRFRAKAALLLDRRR